jgi:hypothetical protein
MLLRRQAYRTAPRRGVILMVVLSMLTLFAIVGLTFVLFSDSAALSAAIARQGETHLKPDVDPELAMAMFLGQMIYDTHDDAAGTASSVRGHSFGRSMYNARFTLDGTFDTAGRPFYVGDNSRPYSGFGRPHSTTANPWGKDDHTLVNYRYNAADGFVRDPEYLGTRASPSAAATTYLPGSSSYTYCDGNSMFMAYMDTSTGEIKVPSFHRSWLGFGSLDPTNPNWTDTTRPELKYMVMSPRQAEHPNFPRTQDAGGHVKNLDWAPGGCDSIWIDIGAPVITMADGRKYKMLVAPLILDLDGRLNLNVAGNILGTGNTHASNQGWGAWEMNPSKVLNSTVAPTEWQNIFMGSSYANTQNTYGRYGTVMTRPSGTDLQGGTFVHDYAKVDLNGINDPGQPGFRQPTAAYQLSGAAGRPFPSWHSFPFYPDAGYGNASPVETRVGGTFAGAPNHPMIYNTLKPTGGDRLIPPQAMHAVLRAGGSGSEFVTSDLRLVMQNLALDPVAAATKRRNQITVLSMDMDRSGSLPYIWDPSAVNTAFTLATTAAGPGQPRLPSGTAPMVFPPLATPLTATPAASEFDPATYRSVLSGLTRLNLSRKLRAYPAVNANGVIDLTVAANVTAYKAAVLDRQQLAQDIFNMLVAVTGAMPVATARTLAPNPPGQHPAYQALRWLAQLSVNIVDFIDEDDYMTPFQWDTASVTADGGWVFGVELPRLVINEAYAQLDNNASDPSLYSATTTTGMLPQFAAMNYRQNVWVELHNPIPAETNPAGHPNSNPNAQLQLNGTSVYRVVLAKTGLIDQTVPAPGAAPKPLSDPGNVTGDPNFNLAGNPSRIYSTVTNFGAGNVAVSPFTHAQLVAGQAYSVASGTGQSHGFFVLGAQPPAYTNPATNPPANPPPNGTRYANPQDQPFPTTFESFESPQMSYDVVPATVDGPPVPAQIPGTTILLRRLACPHLPLNPLPGQTETDDNGKPVVFNPALQINPFITTDTLALNDIPGVTQVYDSRGFLFANPATPPAAAATNPNHVARNNRFSYGRLQPYAAGTPLRQQVPSAPNPPGQTPASPNNTFFRHNATSNTPPATIAAGDTLKTTFDWMVHPDRQVISPMELLNVAAVKPHELTYFFQNDQTASAQQFSHYPSPHLAPWFTETTRLWRFFEFVTSGNMTDGLAPGGRIPGRININTMGAQEIWRAICDAQAGNIFRIDPGNPDSAIDPIFTALIAQRTPAGVPGANDRPFMSTATGTVAAADWATGYPRGLNNSVLSSDGTGSLWTTKRLLEPTLPTVAGYPVGTPQSTMYQPYQRFELLNKIFNNLTVRSNVFAVWMTVGFFAVEDDTTTPPRLGAEIGRSENAHIRHRTFAIVDRTNMQLKWPTSVAGVTYPGAQLIGTIPDPKTLPNTPPDVEVPIAPMVAKQAATARFDNRTNLRWDLQAGSQLVVNPGATNTTALNVNLEETVLLYIAPPTNPDGTPNPNAGQLVGRFRHGHSATGTAAGIPFTIRGNPGPWFRYDPRSDTTVVPYFAVID